MTVFIDTAILMYAGGTEHPLREPSQRILEAVADGRVEAVTSVEVVQEILHRFTALGRPEVGASMAQATLDLFAPVLPITHAVMRRMPDLIGRYQGIAARDLVHVATCLEEGIADIVSPDRGFDEVSEIHRIAPESWSWT